MPVQTVDSIVVARVQHTDFRPIKTLLLRRGQDPFRATEFHEAVCRHHPAYVAKRGLQTVGLVWPLQIESSVAEISRLEVDLPGAEQQVVQQLLHEIYWHDRSVIMCQFVVDEYDVDRQVFLSSCGFIGNQRGCSIVFELEF